MTPKLLTLLTALLLTLPLAHADDTSKRAKIDELFTLTKANQMVDQMLSQMSATIKAQADQQTANAHLTPEQQKLADQFQARTQQILQQSVSMDHLKPILVQVYMDTYTEDEIDGILTFYRSPAGQAFLAKTPQLLTRTITLMQEQMADVQPQFQQAAKDFADGMAKTKPSPTN